MDSLPSLAVRSDTHARPPLAPEVADLTSPDRRRRRGLFGTNLFDQLKRVAGLMTAIVADVEAWRAVNMLRVAGVPEWVPSLTAAADPP